MCRSPSCRHRSTGRGSRDNRRPPASGARLGEPASKAWFGLLQSRVHCHFFIESSSYKSNSGTSPEVSILPSFSLSSAESESSIRRQSEDFEYVSSKVSQALMLRLACVPNVPAKLAPNASRARPAWRYHQAQDEWCARSLRKREALDAGWIRVHKMRVHHVEIVAHSRCRGSLNGELHFTSQLSCGPVVAALQSNHAILRVADNGQAPVGGPEHAVLSRQFLRKLDFGDAGRIADRHLVEVRAARHQQIARRVEHDRSEERRVGKEC